jgi:hypothetical protein
VRTAEAALSAEFHVLYSASRTGQAGQLIGLRAEMLANQVLQDGRQIQLLFIEQMLLLGAALAQVQLFLVRIDNVGQMHRGRVGAELALHAAIPFRFSVFGFRFSDFSDDLFVFTEN